MTLNGVGESSASEPILMVRLVSSWTMSTDETPPVEPWIVDEARAQGASEPRALTGWIEIGAAPRELYRSTRGGRFVVARRTDDGQGASARIEVTGYKIGPVPSWIDLPLRPGAVRLAPLVRYPNEASLFLAAQLY